MAECPDDIGGRLMMPTLAEWYAYLPTSEHDAFRRLWQTVVRARDEAGKTNRDLAADLTRRVAFDTRRIAAAEAAGRSARQAVA